MKTLYKWFLTRELGGYIANGVVYGHSSPNCADGSMIHTSLIQSAEYDGERIHLYTFNSDYSLSIGDLDCECFDALRSLRLFERFSREFGLMQCFPQVRDHYIELDGWINDSNNEINGRLHNGSFYIELFDEYEFYFHKGVYRDLSGKMIFYPSVTEYMVDSRGRMTATFDYILEYVPYRGRNIEFVAYSKHALPDSGFLGIIKNSGSTDLNIRFTWGKTVILAPGSEIEVSEGMGLALPLTCTTQDFD